MNYYQIVDKNENIEKNYCVYASRRDNKKYVHSHDEIKQKWVLDKEFVSNMSEEERNKKYAGWLKAVERSKNWEE